MATSDKKQIVLFDGVCNLCNGIVKFIIKRDMAGQFTFASLQSVTGQNILMKCHLPTDTIASLGYLKDDELFLKSSAVLHVLKDLGGTWKLAFVFAVIPKFLRDSVYNVIAKTRYRVFGKRDTCMVPTPDIKERFLI